MPGRLSIASAWGINSHAKFTRQLILMGIKVRYSKSSLTIDFSPRVGRKGPTRKYAAFVPVETAHDGAERTRRHAINRQLDAFVEKVEVDDWIVIFQADGGRPDLGVISTLKKKKGRIAIHIRSAPLALKRNLRFEGMPSDAFVKQLTTSSLPGGVRKSDAARIQRHKKKGHGGSTPLRLPPDVDLRQVGNIGRGESVTAFSGEPPTSPLRKAKSPPGPGRVGRKSKEVKAGVRVPQLKSPGAIVDLFYGTNRANNGSADYNSRYTTDFDQLRYGYCKVNIPPGRAEGTIQRPKWWKLQFKESKDRDFMILSLDEMDPAPFFSKLSDDLREKETKEAILFIHGFNVAFNECAWRTAQIVHDISFNGLSGFYNWPSFGEIAGYLHDLDVAARCVPYLQQFVKQILAIPEITKLHLIAHSMGCYILANSLSKLAGDSEIRTRLDVVRQVILCAPDIDQQVFREQILPAFKEVGSQRTLYASSNDKALRLSDEFRLGLPRLGESGKYLFVADGIDTVEASNVKTDAIGHGYFSNTKVLLDDIHDVVDNEMDPNKRHLRELQWEGDLVYWLFPE